MLKIVVLVLTVWNMNTGDRLEEIEIVMAWDRVQITNNRMEECRSVGIRKARKLTSKWIAKGYQSASTNVRCRWETRLGRPA